MYVMVNDIHLSDRAPSSCTDSYLSDLFDLLDQVTVIAKQHNSSGIILAGDIFHHKTPSRTSHSTVMRLINWAYYCGTPVYAVLGNHDLSHDRIASVDETQPLGVAIASGAIRLLDGWIDNGDPVYGVPWQMTFDDAAVTDALRDYRVATKQHPGDTTDLRSLVVTHAPLYPPGQELPYEFYPTSAWATAMGNTGTVHYGHVHDAHGIYRVDNVIFSNCGALSRGSLNEHNLTRPVRIALWDPFTGTTTHVELTHKPAKDIFRLPEIAAAKAAQVDLTTFLGSVGETQLSITSTESVVEHIRTLGLQPELEDILRTLLVEADV